MDNDTLKSSQSGESSDAVTARADAVCQAIIDRLPSEQHLKRFLRRHRGFIHAYFTTENYRLALMYGENIHSAAHPLDGDIAKLIVEIVPQYFPKEI